MPRKKSYLTATDQFCGAGGSSQGAKKAGIEVKMALNHWKLAIETHNTNFPDTDHDCTDVSACDPRRYPSTDVLITSPECTNHSLAKGVKAVKKQMDMFSSGKIDPSAERSRATMWDVARFAEYHQYNAIIVENVVDARKWVMFDSWLHAMHALGYNHKCVYINSMHCHPTPQSRDRMYVVFWKKGNKSPNLEFMPVAYCPKCGKDVHAVQTWKNPLKKFGKYKQQYIYCCPTDGMIVEPYYYAAFNCIDWSDIGTRIGDRPKPLSSKTITRIQYGLDKFGNQPMQVINYSPGYTKPLADATGTLTCNDHHGLLLPFLINDQHSTGVNFRVKGVSENLPTIPTTHQIKMVTQPFIVKLEHSQRNNNAAGVSKSLSTQTIRQSSMLVNSYVKSGIGPLSTQTTCQGMALIVENKGQSLSKKVTDPLGSCTTVPHHGLLTSDSWNSFLASFYGNGNNVSHISDAAGTFSTKDRHMLVQYEATKIEDCYYRMLKPFEIKLGMAFDKDYIILGSGKDQVKQCGNAVTPPAMEWLINRVKESLV